MGSGGGVVQQHALTSTLRELFYVTWEQIIGKEYKGVFGQMQASCFAHRLLDMCQQIEIVTLFGGKDTALKCRRLFVQQCGKGFERFDLFLPGSLFEGLKKGMLRKEDIGIGIAGCFLMLTKQCSFCIFDRFGKCTLSLLSIFDIADLETAEWCDGDTRGDRRDSDVRALVAVCGMESVALLRVFLLLFLQKL